MSSTPHFHVRLAGSGRGFEARGDESILAAALRQGIVLPYSCKNGTCASCKCQLVEGEIRYPLNPPQALELEDVHSGHALSCQAVANSDLVLDARELTQVADIVVRKLPARVEHMERFTDDIMALRLKLPRGVHLQFLAGQYIDILLPDGRRRAFSIASAPSQSDYIELHIRHVAGGDFTAQVFSDMKLRDILRLEGPLGTFFVRRASTRPKIMMGGGTGFAPLKAMIEELAAAGEITPDRPISLYWGGAQAHDLYAMALLDDWAKTQAGFAFTPVLTDADETWSGRRGFVHEAVLTDHPDLSAFDVYMSGPPAMIKAARGDFLAASLPEDRLFYDSFDFAGDVPLDQH